jgi:RNA polymerase sigma-70 factor (ECF subfamily)
MEHEYKFEPSDHSVFPGMRMTNHEIAQPVSWDDKEKFIRKTFDDDPQKGCELLFKQYYQPLCSHVVRFVYSREIAEDIVGDIFYSLLEKQLYLQIASSYRAYLFAAARNRSLKHLRKEFGRGQDARDVESLSCENGMPSPQQILVYDELFKKIERTIQSLAPRNQTVFLMNRFEGKKYQQIATELNISVKAVEAHISKALHVLRKAVRDQITVVLLVLLFQELG